MAINSLHLCFETNRMTLVTETPLGNVIFKVTALFLAPSKHLQTTFTNATVQICEHVLLAWFWLLTIGRGSPVNLRASRCWPAEGGHWLESENTSRHKTLCVNSHHAEVWMLQQVVDVVDCIDGINLSTGHFKHLHLVIWKLHMQCAPMHLESRDTRGRLP